MLTAAFGPTAQPVPMPPMVPSTIARPAPGLGGTNPNVNLLRRGRGEPVGFAPEHTREFKFAAPTRATMDLRNTPGLNNLYVELENAGTSTLRNPRVVVNGRRDWYDMQSVLRDAIGAETDPERKAFRLWHFLCDNRYHWYPPTEHGSLHDPVRFLNVYGYGFCDDAAASYCALAEAAGFPTVQIFKPGHVVSQVKYNGAWHLFDSDLHVFYPPRTTHRGALSYEEITSDTAWLTSIHPDEIVPVYTTETVRFITDGWTTQSSMAMTLRPRERVRLNFTHRDHKYSYTRNYYPKDEVTTPPVMANGVHTYIHPDTIERKPGVHIGARTRVRVTTPYVFVGGQISANVTLTGTTHLRISATSDNTTSHTVGWIDAPYTGPIVIDLRTSLNETKKLDATIVEVDFTLTGMAGDPEPSIVQDIVFEGKLQCAPHALPTLLPGILNTVDAHFEESTGTFLATRFGWDAAPAVEIPKATEPVYPKRGETIATDAPLLQWESSVVGPQLLRQVIVSWDADGVIPVSPLTMEMHALTSDPQFQVPTGWLLPGHTYYWRVREVPDDRAPMDAQWDGPWPFIVNSE